MGGAKPYPARILGRGVGLPSDFRWQAYPYRMFEEGAKDANALAANSWPEREGNRLQVAYKS